MFQQVQLRLSQQDSCTISQTDQTHHLSITKENAEHVKYFFVWPEHLYGIGTGSPRAVPPGSLLLFL